MSEVMQLDITAILQQLPHRYPFLLVDRVTECIPGKSVRAIKNVTINEPFFMGHFPGRPVMPGVLIIEALAQTAGVLAFRTAGIIPDETTRFFFVGIDNARFRRPVEPGDRLDMSATLERNLRGIQRYSARAEVAGVEACSCEMMLATNAGGGT